MILKEGSKGPEVKELQKALLNLGYHPGPIDGHFGRLTEEALERFQKKSKIYVDGICGSATLEQLRLATNLSPLLKELEPGKTGEEEISGGRNEQLKWIKCKADKVPGKSGYSTVTLREDAAESYNSLREEILELGGVITSAGGRRGLSSKASPSRSKKSMHYVGLALDLALSTGMQNPSKDPYVIESTGDRKWKIWCKTDNPDVSIKQLTAAKAYRRRGKTVLAYEDIECRAFDLTAIFWKYGWRGIRARRSFFRGGSYGGAEWWHFQYEAVLEEGKSTFGKELLKVYSLAEAKKFIYWNVSKNCVFGKNWF